MIIFDTNFLIYQINSEAAQHTLAQKALEKVDNGEIDGVIALQNYVECHAALRNLIQLSKLPDAVNPMELTDQISSLFMDVITPNSSTMKLFSELIKKYPEASRRTYDTFLVATMLSHDISKIATFNIRDFKHFEEIEVIKPEKLASFKL